MLKSIPSPHLCLKVQPPLTVPRQMAPPWNKGSTSFPPQLDEGAILGSVPEFVASVAPDLGLGSRGLRFLFPDSGQHLLGVVSLHGAASLSLAVSALESFGAFH